MSESRGKPEPAICPILDPKFRKINRVLSLDPFKIIVPDFDFERNDKIAK